MDGMCVTLCCNSTTNDTSEFLLFISDAKYEPIKPEITNEGLVA